VVRNVVALLLLFASLAFAGEKEDCALPDQESIERNAPKLSKSRLDMADELLNFTRKDSLRTYAVDALQKLINEEQKFSYGWYKWQESKLKENPPERERDLLLSLRTLETYTKRDETGRIRMIATCYLLNDGRRVPHGLFMGFSAEGVLKQFGTFSHGLKDGQFVERIGDKDRCNAEWKMGVAWNGTVETMVNRDRVLVEVKEGKVISLPQAPVVSEPRVWFSLEK
jgi:hypothetical protein